MSIKKEKEKKKKKKEEEGKIKKAATFHPLTRSKATLLSTSSPHDSANTEERNYSLCFYTKPSNDMGNSSLLTQTDNYLAVFSTGEGEGGAYHS